jgi:hypothetical protein
VRKDVRNWDEFIPYAVMVYRALPHSSTKYSPYYLVFGRDMRLPIEDDWRPKATVQDIEGNYEEHVKMLAARLKEANEAEGQHSKQSHYMAKRYYDKGTKLEHFEKGDLVYLYDPLYKHGKARKFSPQYIGPYEVELKVSPLNYKLRMKFGTSLIVHINRLKGAYRPGLEVSSYFCPYPVDEKT